MPTNSLIFKFYSRLHVTTLTVLSRVFLCPGFWKFPGKFPELECFAFFLVFSILFRWFDKLISVFQFFRQIEEKFLISQAFYQNFANFEK